MKASEKLKIKSQAEENDIKSFGFFVKSLREKRSEKFEEDWLPLLELRYPLTESSYKYTIDTQDFGKIDFFPKANKILIRKEDRWIKPGLKWIIENLFN